jgi:hypothetical protein
VRSVTVVIMTKIGSKGAASVGKTLFVRGLLHQTMTAIQQEDPAWIIATGTQTEQASIPDIFSLAVNSRSSTSTNPVDKIFAILGLCDKIRLGSTHGITGSYTNHPLHAWRVYVKARRAILSSWRGLHLFSAINHRPPPMRDPFLSVLPSLK